MKKTIKAWAVFRKDVGIFWFTIEATRKASLDNFRKDGMNAWVDMKKDGYRIRRITITVED
jgi:hypothetical protein